MESIQEPQRSARPVLKMKNKGGAPKGNRNAFKHGRYTAERRARRKHERIMRRYARAMHKDAVAFRVKLSGELRALTQVALLLKPSRLRPNS